MSVGLISRRLKLKITKPYKKKGISFMLMVEMRYKPLYVTIIM